MAEKYFPLENNKDLKYPIIAEENQLYPSYYVDSSTQIFKIPCYVYSNNQNSEVQSGWSWAGHSENTIWIGKDVEFLEFGLFQQQSVRHEMTSVAFEDGRTDFQNIFVCNYFLDGYHPTAVEGTETEFTDLDNFPFRINTSIKIPEGVSEFPGITLQAPYDLSSENADVWVCRVVLPKTVESFTIFGSSNPDVIATDKNYIQINPGSNNDYFNLNSNKGTVLIYLLNHEELPEINTDGYISCNLKFILNESTFKGLCNNNRWTESEANEQGFYSLKIYEKSGLETKIAETVDTLKPASLSLSEVDDIFFAPLLEILDIRGTSHFGEEGQPNYMARIEGSAKITNLQTDEVRYLFFDYQGGSIEATLVVDPNDPNTQEEDVSSEVTIDPLYEIYGQPYYTTVSFRGASGTSICPVGYIK